MTEHLWAADIVEQVDEIKNDNSETFYNPASATTTSASEETGNDTSPGPRRLKLIVVVFGLILFIGIVVAIAAFFPKSYGVGDGGEIDDMMVELVPPESRNKASLPRRGYLPDKDFHYKPDFPPRVRSSSPRKPRQSPEDIEITTTSSSSED